ncbi:MAG: hypothetical protein ACHQ17_01725 [Polyangia bacterium]|jgi:hypothetical protein
MQTLASRLSGARPLAARLLLLTSGVKLGALGRASLSALVAVAVGCGTANRGVDSATASDLSVAGDLASADLAPLDLASSSRGPSDLASTDLAGHPDLSMWKCVTTADCAPGNSCCSDGLTYSSCISNGLGASPCSNFFYGTPTCTGGSQCGAVGSPPDYCCPTKDPNVDRCVGFLTGSGSGCFTDVVCTPGSCPANETCVNGYCRIN